MAHLHSPHLPSDSTSGSRCSGPGSRTRSGVAPASTPVSCRHGSQGYGRTTTRHGWRLSATAATTNTTSAAAGVCPDTDAHVATSPATSVRARSLWATSVAASRPSAAPPHSGLAARPTHGSHRPAARRPLRSLTRLNATDFVGAAVADPTVAEGAVGGFASGSDPRVVVVYDLSDQVVEYEQAWAWQRALLQSAASVAASAADGGAASPAERRRGARHSLLLLQHPPVYTLGAGSTTDHLRFPRGSPPIPLHRTERGGEVTYHGPGQLVMYPILDLQALKPDLHWYLRQLEQVVIEALDAVSGLQGERIEGLTGVWVDGAKVAAIGVRAKRWVSYHGLALNVVTDLGPFSRIVPCGIADRPVTSVQRLLEARRAEEDPFAPPTDGLLAGTDPAAGAGGDGDDDGMIPLAEATQEDLRRMLARTGMRPPVMGDDSLPTWNPSSDPDLDLDDPFAAPMAASPPASLGSTPPEAASAAAPASGGDGGGVSELRVRGAADWTEDERLLLREYGCALLEAFSEVFGLRLVAGDTAELTRL